jgi:type I restriction enzyme S subunit
VAGGTETRTYRASEAAVFRRTTETFGGLSNMAPGFPLSVDGIEVRSTEALYQACRFPFLPDLQAMILRERSPMTAKMKARPFRSKTRDDWDVARVRVMRWCLRLKLAQNWHRFSELLLATTGRPIVEDSTRDPFWGARRDENGLLVGCNVLGRLLMELRSEVQQRSRADLLHVSPPRLPSFLLLGRPVGRVSGADVRDQAEDNIGPAAARRRELFDP